MRLPFINKAIAPFRVSLKRSPGARLREQHYDAAFDFTFALCGLAGSLVVACLSFSPGLILPASLAAFVVFLVLLVRAHRRLQSVKRGLLGEVQVGKTLSEMERYGYRVMHDLEGDGFNIDHVMIGPEGVYAVETKYISKRAGADAKLVFNGTSLFIRDKPLKGDAVAQAKRGAADVERLLKNKGFAVEVRPIVVIPGWFIEGKAQGPNAPWVLELKAVPKWLQNEPTRLTEDEVKRIHFALREVVERT